MIELNGLKEDKDRLSKYKEDFEYYIKRRTYETSPPIEPSGTSNSTQLHVKLESNYCHALIDFK